MERASAHLPTNPFTRAACYVLERQKGVDVYLADPGVPIDNDSSTGKAGGIGNVSRSKRLSEPRSVPKLERALGGPMVVAQ